ncbi:MAG TPA: DUF2007 domain-containing protein [Anaerolineales bacterium]|nr:DUF2007 domain-containing protein [Anaerolineales bacterium]
MDDSLKWSMLTEVTGRGQAELLKSFLEAEGVEVQLIQESAGQSLFPVSIEGLGSVQVFVPNEKMEAARELLKDFETGEDAEFGDDDGSGEEQDAGK